MKVMMKRWTDVWISGKKVEIEGMADGVNINHYVSEWGDVCE